MTHGKDGRERADRPSRGIALMLFGSGLLTLNDTAMKWVVADHTVGEAVFVRGLFALLPIALIVRQSGGWGAIVWRSSSGQLVSAILLASALFTFIFSLVTKAIVAYLGGRLILTLLEEMARRDVSLGLVTLCVGGGQGGAMVLERN